MIEKILLLLLVLSGLVCLIGLIGYCLEEPSTPVSKLLINKSTFVNLVIDWCHTHIPNKVKNKPAFVVKYYLTKNTHGVYNPSNNLIVIYVNTHHTLEHLVNTIIHEYIHAGQRNRSFIKMYDQYTQELGYWDNPYEIEARQEAAKYQMECIKYFKRYYI